MLTLMVRTNAQQKVEEESAECILTVKGKPPVGLREFYGFEILPFLPDNSTPSNQQYEGGVTTTGVRDKVIWYEYSKLVIKGRQINFTTVAIRGLGYQFAGNFTRDKITSALEDTSVVVVEGLVTKFTNNRKVVEAKLQFTCKTPVD
jgi:hypothetical protein